MATALTRNANRLRHVDYRCFSSHTLTQCRSTIPSLPFIDALRRRTLSSVPLIPYLGLQFQSLPVKQRLLLLSTSSTSETESEKSEPQSVDNEGGEKSNDSNQSKSESGKSVHDGPICWLSFVLLVITGAGIIRYYDKEKKRYIEGRFLW